MNDEIVKIEKDRNVDLDLALIKLFAKKMSTTESAIEACIQVLLREPANEMGCVDNTNNEHEHVKERPTSAHHYLEDFVY